MMPHTLQPTETALWYLLFGKEKQRARKYVMTISFVLITTSSGPRSFMSADSLDSLLLLGVLIAHLHKQLISLKVWSRRLAEVEGKRHNGEERRFKRLGFNEKMYFSSFVLVTC